jgi:hypothetical protein
MSRESVFLSKSVFRFDVSNTSSVYVPFLTIIPWRVSRHNFHKLVSLDFLNSSNLGNRSQSTPLVFGMPRYCTPRDEGVIFVFSHRLQQWRFRYEMQRIFEACRTSVINSWYWYHHLHSMSLSRNTKTIHKDDATWDRKAPNVRSRYQLIAVNYQVQFRTANSSNLRRGSEP